jgi:hypothetical protein
MPSMQFLDAASKREERGSREFANEERDEEAGHSN